ncbi:MAG: glycosyltransferase family 1 protein [Clostridia bacterium]|nr:glycosyltransferase family 1 protein [Clostridia bacterium]
MIRILHSVSNMDRGGIETMLMNYYRHIDRTKVQFDFLCNKKKLGAYEAEIESMGGRIFRTPGLNPLKFFKYQAYMKKLFRENPEYRIVEAHNGAFGLFSLIAACKARIPVRIFHAHGASITKDWKLPLKILCKKILPLNINQRFSCGIAAARCYFGEKIVQTQDYVIVNNAIEIERFLFNAEVRERIRKRNGLADKFIVGHVGRFMAQKNHEYLLEIFAALKEREPNAHLVLLGDGELKEAMEEKADQMNIRDSISFMGNVENTNEWYQAFDVMVLPSIWEGLPLVGVEAQAADLPCVFSDSITREVGILEKTVFVGIDEGIEAWVTTIQNKKKEIQRGNVRDLIAQSGYDISTEVVKLQEWYMKLAGV